ncbi:MMPL family transporter [Candidatus Woesearchaeota archaeon]|nr:MMPL family transporter [Candidatus Woesearchaeota archaeon]
MIKKIIERYAKFLAHRPFIILILVIILSGLAIQQSQKVQTKGSDYEDLLPADMDVMKALHILNDQFGGSNSAMYSIELDPADKYSKLADIRDPEVIRYIHLLGEMTLNTDYVESVSSASTLIKGMNDNHLPKSLSDVIKFEKNNMMLKSYLSEDHTLALIKISLSDDYDEKEIVKLLNEIVDYVPQPPGIMVSLAGNTIAQPIVQEKLGPDMAKTSQFSLVGILIVLLVLLRSIKYSFIPLTTIGVGVIWAFGYIGLIGMSISSVTSGVISMIMGIGIDFGIQTVMRFRQELKSNTGKFAIEDAMSTTMSNVIMPMATTTLAALIGFKAMSMGQLTMMAEMGTMMSYGIAACFMAAITVVPALLVIFEIYFGGRKNEKNTFHNNSVYRS